MMREFGKISFRFWENEDLRQFDIHTGWVANYLITGIYANSIGVYRILESTIAYDCRLPEDEIKLILDRLISINFIQYDFKSKWVWVVNMLHWHIGDGWNSTDKRIIGMRKEFELVSKHSFYDQFIDKYPDFSCQKLKKLSTVSKLSTIQEGLPGENKGIPKEKEKEKDTDTEKELRVVNSANPSFVFSHWRTLFQHPRHELKPERLNRIQAAFAMGFDQQDLCDAITGCSLTPYNMGKNPKGEKFYSLQVIFENENSIRKFISTARQSNVAKLEGLMGQAFKKV